MKELLGSDCQGAVFIIPDPESFPSGGNIYNRRLIDKILKSGVMVWQVENRTEVNVDLFEQADVLILDSLFLNSTYQWVWDQYLSKEKVIIFHHLDCLELESFEAQEACFKAYQQYMNQADRVLVTSEFSQSWLNQQGISKEKILVIPPTIHWEASPHSIQKDDTFIALMVANLIPRKGILPFLQALDTILTAELKFEIHIAGSFKLDPQYAQSCQHFVDSSRYLASRISFLQEVPPNKMPQLYQQADVFISASSMETFGMALQEAQHAGLPIFALGGETEGGNIASFCVDEKRGGLYPDFQSLVKALLDCVNS